MRRIAIIGTGYVGLVSGAGLADFGNEVICTDINEGKINKLYRGDIPFYEPGLKELVDRNISAGRLSFSADIGKSVKKSEVVLIAVWTPMSNDGDADLSAVEDVARAIGENLNGYKVVCMKSTVPIGTSEIVRRIISEHSSPGAKFDIVSNPEFIREGAAVNDFLIPDRVVIGSDSENALAIMKEVYRPLFIIETPMVITDIVTAETIKYASNSFLAVKISYINEMANLCDATGADVHVVARAMGLDGRISPKFLHPGPGFGGSCFPKDTRALVQQAESRHVQLRVVEAAITANEAQINKVISKLTKLMSNNLKGKTVSILGLAFKANTDDVRQSPAVPLIEYLLKSGAMVKAFDPKAIKNMSSLFPEISYHESLELAVKNADAAVIMTEWHEIRGIDLETVAGLMNEKILVDARNLLNPAELKRLNFRFENIGRPNVK